VHRLKAILLVICAATSVQGGPALPWSLELEAFRRLPTNVLGVALALEPAIAALAGLLFLDERLHLRSWLAIVLVVVASAGAAFEVRRERTDPVEA
jgi:inner membrane transporter RhtA